MKTDLEPGVTPKLQPVGADASLDVYQAAGKSIRSWATDRGYNPRLVYQVLRGERKCLRGQSHLIATELGMK